MQNGERLHALDTVRAFALLLGVAFHAAISFVPGMIVGIWAIVDRTPSVALSDAAFVSHIFRMSLFFFIAGFFARMLYMRGGARGFWSNRLKRILVPLIAGWVVVFPAIAWVWTVGIKKTYGDAAPPFAMQMPEVTLGFPLTHLWFLYYLLVLYVAILAVRAVFVRLDSAGKLRAAVDALARWCISGYAGNFLFGLPLAACLLALPFWVYWQGIPTPDHSLLPQWPSFVGFSTAMIVGWIVHRSTSLLGEMQRRYVGHLSLAVIASAVCVWILHSQAPLTPVAPGTYRTVFVLSFGIALWSWVFGLVGAALRFFSGYSAVRRYIADASYWIYIVHLPIVVALQVAVAQWPLHWSLKYTFVLAASLAILIASYHLFVRFTFIGQLLNGRKYSRRGAGQAEKGVSVQESKGSVARLHGVSKNYGETRALDRVDLDIAPGRLTAVLGPNGAGKSTAISLLLGLLEPDEGSVTIFDGSPLAVETRRKVGVMMQSVELPRELRVRELVTLAASYYPDPRPIEDVLAFAGIEALADRTYGKLSGGQKRQVQFAMAVCGRPQLLFLDEPTVGLDVTARQTLWTAVRTLVHEGCSIVLTTHYLEEAEALADHVVVLAKAQVIARGTIDEVRSIVSRRHISCESSIQLDEIKTWPGVVTAARDTSMIRITATDAEDVVRRLFARDEKVRRLEIRNAGLHEAFETLTRDAA